MQRFMASEFSPTVQLSNWKEEMQLQRKLQHLSSHEARAARQIHSEQHLVVKKFEKKVERSRQINERLVSDIERQMMPQSYRNQGMRSASNGDVVYTEPMSRSKPTGRMSLTGVPSTTTKQPSKMLLRRHTVDNVLGNTVQPFASLLKNVPAYGSEEILEEPIEEVEAAQMEDNAESDVEPKPKGLPRSASDNNLGQQKPKKLPRSASTGNVFGQQTQELYCGHSNRRASGPAAGFYEKLDTICEHLREYKLPEEVKDSFHSAHYIGMETNNELPQFYQLDSSERRKSEGNTAIPNLTFGVIEH